LHHDAPRREAKIITDYGTASTRGCAIQILQSLQCNNCLPMLVPNPNPDVRKWFRRFPSLVIQELLGRKGRSMCTGNYHRLYRIRPSSGLFSILNLAHAASEVPLGAMRVPVYGFIGGGTRAASRVPGNWAFPRAPFLKHQEEEWWTTAGWKWISSCSIHANTSNRLAVLITVRIWLCSRYLTSKTRSTSAECGH
jgi:hypothetical protein